MSFLPDIRWNRDLPLKIWPAILNEYVKFSPPCSPPQFHSLPTTEPSLSCRDLGEMKFGLHLKVNLLNEHFPRQRKNLKHSIKIHTSLKFAVEFSEQVMQTMQAYTDIRMYILVKMTLKTHCIREKCQVKTYILGGNAYKRAYYEKFHTEMQVNFHEDFYKQCKLIQRAESRAGKMRKWNCPSNLTLSHLPNAFLVPLSSHPPPTQLLFVNEPSFSVISCSSLLLLSNLTVRFTWLLWIAVHTRIGTVFGAPKACVVLVIPC